MFLNKSKFILFLSVTIFFQSCSIVDDKVQRKRVLFNDDWKFINEDLIDAHLPSFDDDNWRELSLPHDWAIEGPFTEEVSFKGGYLPYPGVGWYRKSFSPTLITGNLYLEFGGIMRNSKVFLNGEYIGGWPYGYTSFKLDITDKVIENAENVIAIRVENQDRSSRWYPGSGIYRNVWMNQTHLTHVDHWGTYITTPEIKKDYAKIVVETDLVNKQKDNVSIELITSIFNSDGNLVALTNNKGIEIASESKTQVSSDLIVENHQLWDLENPHLYTAQSEVILNGEIIDTYDTKFGVRSIEFDADKGFSLNGKNLKLKGVNLHHDLGPLGAAVNTRALERQLEIMKEMGVNAIRTAHNPPSSEQLSLCDEMGILVIDETFDEWSTAKTNVENSYNIWFDEWAARDTRALLKRDRNHPSVIMWSIGNEVPDLDTEVGKKNAKMLSDICREMDPTRPVNAGVHLSTVFDKELEKYFDVFGMNYWQDRYDLIHSQFPELPLLSTETSATLSSRGVYHFPVERVYSEYYHHSKQITSYDVVNTGFGALPDLEFELQKVPWIAGEFVWSGFDYHGEPDPYESGNYPAHSSYFGIVDMSGFKKDRFYLYQSQWTSEPMIHLLPHWNWENRLGEVTPIYIYSNCASVELFVNGDSKGVKKNNEDVYRFIWDDITYQPGSIKAVGYDSEGKKLCEKEIFTADVPKKLSMSADRETINADGYDLSFITVKVEDENHNLCPKSSNLIYFEIEGEGTLAAVGNGDPTCIESYQMPQRSAFNGLALLVVKSTTNSGKVKIIATSEGLEKSEITINSVKTK
jgi:beta-galactosidase